VLTRSVSFVYEEIQRLPKPIVYPKPSGQVRLPSSFALRRDKRPLTEFGEGDDFAGSAPVNPAKLSVRID
jgi:hypothetical protein